MNTKCFTTMIAVALLSAGAVLAGARKQSLTPTTTTAGVHVQYKTVTIDGLDVFYREAGPSGAPVVLLLHGFPTSSHMFRNLIPALADRFRLVAPDYPGFGNSSMPTVHEFEYTFDNLAHIIEKFTEQVALSRYTLYVQDYGAPIGFRLAAKHPQRVQALVIKNGNAYEEGLRDFWKPFRAYWSDRSAANTAALDAIPGTRCDEVAVHAWRPPTGGGQSGQLADGSAPPGSSRQQNIQLQLFL